MYRIKFVLTIIVVLVVIFIAASTIASVIFKRNVGQEVQILFSKVENKGEIVTEDDIEGLPGNVQRWLKYSGVIGREKIVSVRLKQRASMRLGEDNSWMPVEAEQYFTSEEPGFIWRANIKVAPLINIAGRDKYHAGEGNMLIKPLSLLTVADAKGKEIDQATLLRYLAETMWFPSAVLEEYITWEEIDEDHSKATMTYGDITASGIFTFNEEGEAIKFEAERYGEFNGVFSLETWSIPVSNYKEFEGIRIPTKGEVTWKLADGDFNWFNFEVVEIEYNRAIPY
ncbi:DUF6544 family protein [Serpentinicella alkaliphila]|uniref:Uncharacterized protein n=1 Tax=Serpentinicella alkaliphila TaxID=1734049 RepID=A0A4R2TQG9_9FIRM|nr:DUF6544 family protein [Serpentinicella alkaliphila]QUH26034.1 hypothetical protein HZR23_10005 [Serpentinicella alkaliphila]TCP99728.1 hypothetical protein EDD79_103416 [Serpentinicella alkaliphila]